jgi:two-component system, NarL family, sensor histidine kinase UhpB
VSLIRIAITRLLLVLLLLNIAGITNCTAQNNTSIDSLQQVLKTQAEDTLKCKTYTEIIKYYYGKGNFKLAKENSLLALSLSERIKFKKGIADAYNNIGLNDENMGNFEEAKQNYFKSLKIREEIGGAKGMAFTYNNLGTIYRRQGQFKEALNYFYKSLKLKEELLDKKGAALTLNNIGLIYVEQNADDDAFANYENALKYYIEINDKNGQAMVYNNQGLLHKKQGKSDKALIDFNKALSLNRETGNKNWIASNLTNIGGIYLNEALAASDRSDTTLSKTILTNALSVLLEANSLNVSSGNKYNFSANLITLGEVQQGLGNYNESQKFLDQALGVATEAGLKSVMKDAYMALSRLHKHRATLADSPQSERLNLMQSSFKYYTAAEAIKDSIYTEESTRQLAELKTKYDLEKKDKEIALLNTEKNLQQLSLKEQQSALLVSRLQSEKTRSEMEILNQSKALQEMQLTKTQQELVSQMLEAKSQSAQLEIEKKNQALQEEQLGREQLLRNVILIGVLVMLVVSLLLFNRYKLQQKLKHQQSLINQRKHISADLHDDVGSTLSSISIYSEAIKNKLRINEPEKVMELVHKIGDTSRETISNLSDIVWSINPVNDSGKVVLGRMESFGSSILSSRNIKLDFTCDPELFKKEFGMELKQNLFLIYKEAINNAAKYSNATLVKVALKQMNSQIHMTVSDNGGGFTLNTTPQNGYSSQGNTGGNGLINMKQRSDQQNGTFHVTSSSGGTTIDVVLPAVWS